MKLRILISAAMLCTAFGNLLHAQKIGDSFEFGQKYILEGIMAHDSGEYEEAIEAFKKVMPGDSLYVLAQYELALSQKADSLFDEAVETLNSVIEFEDEYMLDALLLKGGTLDSQKKSKESIAVLDEAAKRFGHSNRPFYERAVAKVGMKDYEGALQDLGESLRRNYMHTRTHMLIAQIANDLDRGALASMASSFAMLTVNRKDQDYMSYCVVFMESICNRKNTKLIEEAPSEIMSFADPLLFVDEIVYSKSALSKTYKSKVKGDFTISKQLQVICETMAKEEAVDHPILGFYMRFFQNVWAKKHFPGLMGALLGGIENSQTQSVAKGLSSKTKLFQRDVMAMINASRSAHEVISNGKKFNGVSTLNDNYPWLFTEGTDDANVKGKHFYFHSSGYLSAEGMFADNVKDGLWTYYYANGIIKGVENFENGLRNGESLEYNTDGVLTERSFYTNGKAKGLVTHYNGDGSKANEYELDGTGKVVGSYSKFQRHNVLEYKLRYTQPDVPDLFTSYNEDGSEAYTLNFVSGELSGMVKVLNAEGKMTAEGEIKQGDKVGEWKIYHENGQLAEINNYKSNKLDGLSKEYTENGLLSSEVNYKGGKLNGLALYYDDAGIKISEILYKNGRSMDYKVFNADGTVLEEMTSTAGSMYVKGFNDLRIKTYEGKLTKEQSEDLWLYYYPNGQKKTELTYVHDKREGKGVKFHMNGTKQMDFNYTNDALEGFYQEFTEAGILLEEAYYSAGELNGPYKSYYSNGKLRISAFYNLGVLNGPHDEYSFDGALMYRTIYRHGVRFKGISYDTTGQAISSYVVPGGTGLVEITTPLNFVRYRSQWIDNHPTETSIELNGNGDIRSKTNWKNGEREGEYTLYFLGDVVEQGMYKKNAREGVFTHYEDKKVTFKINYEQGSREGLWESYHPNGKIAQQRQYKNDLKHGDVIIYNELGQAYLKMTYYQGVLISYSLVEASGQFKQPVKVINDSVELIAYHPNGKKAQEGKMVNGNWEGVLRKYTSEGKLFSEFNYKASMEHGVKKEFHTNGKLRSTTECVNDLNHGIEKVYYENGNLKMEMMWFEGYPHGSITLYNEQGAILKQGQMFMGAFVESPVVIPTESTKPSTTPKPNTKTGNTKK